MRATTRERAGGRPRRRRPFWLGFLLGAALVVPGVLVALLVPVAEQVWPFLTPGATLLRLLPGDTATWPGGLSLLVAAVANGLVVGALAVTLAVVLRPRPRRRARR